MISFIRPLPSGNALRVFIEPPTGATSWRVLRKAADTFEGPVDEFALLAYEGCDKTFVDISSLTNGQMAFYKAFFKVAGAWVETDTATGTPDAIYLDHTTDVIPILRDRLEAGMQVEVARGNLVNESGYVQVYSAPPTMEQGLMFPLITVELDNAGPGDRGIGEDIYGEDFDSDDLSDSEGWLEHVTCSVVAWSLNPDERIEMRKAMRRVLLANLGVLDGLGVQQVSFSFTDINATDGQFNAPIYQAVCNFSCVAQARVSAPVGIIREIQVAVRT